MEEFLNFHSGWERVGYGLEFPPFDNGYQSVAMDSKSVNLKGLC